jgi:hypothetical protein
MRMKKIENSREVPEDVNFCIRAIGLGLEIAPKLCLLFNGEKQWL